MAFLQEERRIKRILETFHSEIPGIVKDFNGHAEKLSKMMEVETLVTVNNIRDKVDQIEEFSTYLYLPGYPPLLARILFVLLPYT